MEFINIEIRLEGWFVNLVRLVPNVHVHVLGRERFSTVLVFASFVGFRLQFPFCVALTYF